MIWDSLQEILFTIKQNRLRTALTGFGVFWGIFMLVLLLGAGEGLKRGIESTFSSDVRNAVWISATKTSLPYKGLAVDRYIRLTESDLVAIKQQVKGIEILSAEQQLGSSNREPVYISRGNKSGSFSVYGVASGYFLIKKFQDYHDGRRLNDFDESENRKVVVIGTKVAQTLFSPNAPVVGQQIIINGVSVMVIGLFYDPGWEGRMSERIYMPLSAYQKTFGKGGYIQTIAATPKAGVSNKMLIDQISSVIRERHQISPYDKNALRIFDMAEASENINATFFAVNLFLWFVGLGTLAAGMVGISNIMIISVKERTQEIGIRKALGSPPAKIIRTILTESLLVTVLAGYLGLIFSVGLLELYNYFSNAADLSSTYFKNPQVDMGIALIALFILVVVGAIAGLIPAWHAARISPIEAMRAE